MSERRAPFTLTQEERNTSLWLRLMDHFGARIQALREENDSPANSLERTAAIRGEVAVLRALQKLNTPRPPEQG
jgi:hypothetical protein